VRDGVLSVHMVGKTLNDPTNYIRCDELVRELSFHNPLPALPRLAAPRSLTILELQITSSYDKDAFQLGGDSSAYTIRAPATLTFHALFHIVLGVTNDGGPSGSCYSMVVKQSGGA
jgi:hypothetical protein